MPTEDHELCGGADFCHEIAGSRDVAFQRIYEGFPSSRRISTTHLFVVIADLSPLTLGHILVLPKQHYLSFAQVVAEHEFALHDTIQWLFPRYLGTFGSPVILEHGSVRDDDHNACITHAHWHVLPIDGRAVDETMQADGLTRVSVPDLSHLVEPPWIETPYFLSWYSSHLSLYQPLEVMPRQYVRSVIGRLLGMQDPDWDYAVSVRRETLQQTMAMTRGWIEASGGLVRG